MLKKGRRNARTTGEIDELKQKIAVTSTANRHFISDTPAALEEEVQIRITFTAIRVFAALQFLTPLTSEGYCKINHADLVNKMEQAKQYCIIYNAYLTTKEMQTICLVVQKYIGFISTLPHYTKSEVKESAMKVRKLDPALYNITKRTPW